MALHCVKLFSPCRDLRTRVATLWFCDLWLQYSECETNKWLLCVMFLCFHSFYCCCVTSVSVCCGCENGTWLERGHSKSHWGRKTSFWYQCTSRPVGWIKGREIVNNSAHSEIDECMKLYVCDIFKATQHASRIHGAPGGSFFEGPINRHLTLRRQSMPPWRKWMQCCQPIYHYLASNLTFPPKLHNTEYQTYSHEEITFLYMMLYGI